VIDTTPSNLLHCVYLTINRIAPDYEGIELGIGEGLLVKAIAESSGRSVAQIKNELEKTGDLGDIAQVIVSKQIQVDFRNPKELNQLCLNPHH
jgi:DNA ligase 1